MSERITEHLLLKEMGIEFGKNNFCCVYEQGDVKNRQDIMDLLAKAGGKPSNCELDNYSIQSKGFGKPEFIITINSDPHWLIVIECKKNVSKHQSEKLDHPKEYAVDGVLYYAKFLKQKFNIIAIAVSGTSKEKIKVSTFKWLNNTSHHEELQKGKDVLYTPENYINLINGQEAKKAVSIKEIQDLAWLMHNNLRSLKMTEKNKPIFIAGILIALKDKRFEDNYSKNTDFSILFNSLCHSIKTVLESNVVKDEKIENIISDIKKIGENTALRSIPLEQDNSLKWYIKKLANNIKPMMDNANEAVDALGIFYHEFVKYTGGDGSGLGIVLTPQHLTEFMVDLAGVNKSSKVVDICCGSGAFLVTAMTKMMTEANYKDCESIKRNQLFGVEENIDMYTLAIANMIVRGDGKSNIEQGDCFDKKIIDKLKEKNINVGLINPPYSQKDHCELEFVEKMLDILTTNGIGVAVVPVSCAIGTKFKDVRERLFKKHTLLAVFSMPSDIFYSNNANTNTCVMVWKAKSPHDKEHKTFFGYYKDDGFVKAKKLGRIDKNNKWEGIKKEWIENYRDKIIKNGLTAYRHVNWDDEWLCEAYMETDYSKLTDADFEKTIKNYLAYLVKSGENDDNAKN